MVRVAQCPCDPALKTGRPDERAELGPVHLHQLGGCRATASPQVEDVEDVPDRRDPPAWGVQSGQLVNLSCDGGKESLPARRVPVSRTQPVVGHPAVAVSSVPGSNRLMRWSRNAPGPSRVERQDEEHQRPGRRQATVEDPAEIAEGGLLTASL